MAKQAQPLPKKRRNVPNRIRSPRNQPYPWERQPGEPEAAFKNFEVYRDLEEERSLVATARAAGIHDQTAMRQSSQYRWVERALAYDNYMQRAKILKRRKDIERMQERHVNTALMFQQKVVERLRTLNPEELSVEQVAKWFDLATRVERTSRGEQDQPAVQINVGTNGPEPAMGLDASSANPLADYLNRHPDRIPVLMPVVERFLKGDTDALRELEHLTEGSGSDPGEPLPLAIGAPGVRPADVGDGDGTSPASEG